MTSKPSKPDVWADKQAADAAQQFAVRLSERIGFFVIAVGGLRSSGLVVDQGVVDTLTDLFGVPQQVLPVKKTEAPTIMLAPTDIARVVSVNEARASAGLGGLLLPDGNPDPDGDLTVEQFSTRKAVDG